MLHDQLSTLENIEKTPVVPEKVTEVIEVEVERNLVDLQ